LTASAPGFATNQRSDLAFAAGGEYDAGDLRLERAVELLGVVVDENGRGVAGAELRSAPADAMGGFELIAFGRGSGRLVATSDGDGRFEIRSLAAGPWRLSVEHPEHPVRSFDGTTARPGETVSGLRFELPTGAVIAGRVVNVALRPGILRVSAQAAGTADGMGFMSFGFAPGALTGAVEPDGTFEVKGLERDQDYELVVLREPDDEFGGDPFGGEQVSEPKVARSGARDVELTVVPSGRLQVTVVDARSGEPIEEFDVSYGPTWNLERLRSTDGWDARHPGGVALFQDLPMVRAMPFDGGPLVSVAAPGYVQYRNTLTPPKPGETVDLGRVALERAPMARISVRGPNGPVAGAAIEIGRRTSRGVELGDESGNVAVTFTAAIGGAGEEPVFEGPGRGTTSRARTDEQGRAELTLPSASGTVELRIEHGDHAPFVASVEIQPGEDLEYTAVLGPGGTAIVRVLDSAGQPLPSIPIEHRAPGDRGFFGGDLPRTDARGEVRFTRLAPGTHRFRTAKESGMGGIVFATAGESRANWTDVELEHGVERTVDLVHESGRTVYGTVRQDGEPLAAARVELTRRRTEGASGAESRAMLTVGAYDVSGGASSSVIALGGGDQSDRTDGEGRYSIEGVAPGEYTLSVTHASRAAPARFDVVVTAAGDLLRDVDLARNGIRGVVRDEDGRPVAGLSVGVANDGGLEGLGGLFIASGAGLSIGGGSTSGATTDADGRFELVGVPTDRDVRVSVSESTAAPYTLSAESEPVRVGEGEWKDGLSIVVRSGGALEVLVGAERAAEYTFASVRAVRLDPTGGEIAGSDVFGFIDGARTELRGLEPGTWRVDVQSIATESTPFTRDVVVRRGELARLDL